MYHAPQEVMISAIDTKPSPKHLIRLTNKNYCCVIVIVIIMFLLRDEACPSLTDSIPSRT